MKQKKLFLNLIFMFCVSLIIFQAAVNNRNKSSSGFSTPTTIYTAQLTETSPIVINSNSDWAGLTSFSWCNGSGTDNDPYIISNIRISAEFNCITVNSTNISFIIQNSEFSISQSSTSGIGYAGVYLYNVEKGIVYNNEFYDQFGSDSIQIRECYNVSVVGNTVNHAFWGIKIADSDTININGNFITDCYIGVAFHSSDNCYVSYNEIRLTGTYIIQDTMAGISLWYADFNTIIENHFYCVPICIEYRSDSSNYGNTVENNHCHPCNFYNPQEILDLEYLILSLLLIGEIIATPILFKRLPNRKRRTGIILVGIGLGAMGLLAHVVYNLFAAMSPPNYIYQYKLLFYIAGLLGLIAGHIALLLIGIKLIRKYGKKRAAIENK